MRLIKNYFIMMILVKIRDFIFTNLLASYIVHNIVAR